MGKWSECKTCRMLALSAGLLVLLVPLAVVGRIGVREICSNQANSWAGVWCIVVQFDIGIALVLVGAVLLKMYDRKP